LKKAFFVILGLVIVFWEISTLIPDVKYVGKIGHFLAYSSITIFAKLAYFFPIYLGWIAVLIYKDRVDYNNALKLLGVLIIFIDLLIFQSLVSNKGVVGNLLTNGLKTFIGIIGVLLFIFITFIFGVFILFHEKKFILDILDKFGIDSDLLKNLKFSIDFETILNKLNYPRKVLFEIPVNEDEVFEHKIYETEVKEDKSSKNLSYVEDIVLENRKEHIKNSDKIQEIKEEEILKKDDRKGNKVKKVEVLEDTKKLLSEIEIGERKVSKNWKFPSIGFLTPPPKEKREINEAEIDKKIKILIEKLKQFKIEGDVVRYYVGPIVTTFEFKPLPHIKISKILALQDDLAMALKAPSIRIQAPIPGKDVVGIEIPNDKREVIYLREILESDIFQKSKSPLTIALGKDIVGSPFVTDLKKLPHLLIAGTTGSGKSVGINAMIMSLLYKNSPDELKFVMIDPKVLEFSIYEDIPHLLTPVINEPKKAVVALNAMVKEMERRYKLMAKMRVKNIESYNQKADKKLPYIVIIIDELADLMMTSGKDVEYAIARLAQMARASGIHLIVATQRPSVDVVTGLIKANLPSRISFKVGQKIDSKVILDQFGAESLLGRGDMLFTPPSTVGLLRLHAPFVSEEEINRVVEFLKSQREVKYDTTILNLLESDSSLDDNINELDELFEEAKKIILTEKRTSISYLQRRLQIGYNRAANIIEQMERMGILSPPNSKGQREILQ